MNPLELLSTRQASCSTTANQLKASLDRVRWSTLTLSVLGAVLATVASQLPDASTRRWVAMTGAVALAVATFLLTRLGSATHVSAWVRLRAAAEALKREAFKFASRAAPYDVPNADQVLVTERTKIESSIDDLGNKLVDTGKTGSAPTAMISPDDYIAKRVKAQVDGFYRPKARQFAQAASRLRAIEFVLALVATIITGAVGVMEKYPLPGFSFDFAALTAVLTTIGALILAHIEASRYDFLVTTYLATARRLEDAMFQLAKTPPVPSPEWSSFVEQCESIIATENSSWVAKWTEKP